MRVAMGHAPSEGVREGKSYSVPLQLLESPDTPRLWIASFPSSTFTWPLAAAFTSPSLGAGLLMSTKFPFHRDISHIELGATSMT